jgi:hypothetical protein
METAVTKDELYTLVKQAVKEVIKEERIETFLKSIPDVSPEEMADIVAQHGEPSERISARSIKL